MPRRFEGDTPVWRVTEPPPITWTLPLRTITPLFGGSATPREIGDPPIRAASVRGDLRFWWRATAGAVCTTAQDLYEAEREIWGDTERPGKVAVRVEVTDSGRIASLRDYLPERPSPREGAGVGYFLFPFDENKGDKLPAADGRKDVAFSLVITMPHGFDKQEEVRRALKAWLAFGGIGARTRRGCGTLSCDEPAWLPKAAADIAPLRSLINWLLIDDRARGGEESWRYLARFWARFRKGHFTDRRPAYSPMSGGEWRDHATLKERCADSIALGKPFLGMPVVYQQVRRGDYSGTIEPGASGRMASPIILKPVAFADGKIRPMVACLSAPQPKMVKIDGHIRRLDVPTDDPVLNTLGASDPLDAVRKAALRSGFKEVTL